MPLILLPFQEHLLQWIHVDCWVWGLFLWSFPTQKPMSVMPLPTFELFPNLNDLTMHSSEWTMKIKEDVSSFGSSFSFFIFMKIRVGHFFIREAVTRPNSWAKQVREIE